MKIAIIGCGWLGFPTAEKMFANGHQVYGSTTNKNKLRKLNKAGINSFLYDGKEFNKVPFEVKEVDLLLVNFPPSKSKNYELQIGQLINQFGNTCKIIFTSSTSVYKDVEGEIDESSALKQEHPIFLTEQLLSKGPKKWIILRLAGLIGPERHPINYLSGKIVKDGDAVVNLVHLNDVIGVIEKILTNDAHWNNIYNVCWPEHPTKKEYYTKAAKLFQILEPEFELSAKKGKKVIADKIMKDFDFRYSNPI